VGGGIKPKGKHHGKRSAEGIRDENGYCDNEQDVKGKKENAGPTGGGTFKKLQAQKCRKGRENGGGLIERSGPATKKVGREITGGV